MAGESILEDLKVFGDALVKMAGLSEPVAKATEDIKALSLALGEAKDRTAVDLQALADATLPARDALSTIAGAVKAAVIDAPAAALGDLGTVANAAVGAFQSVTGAVSQFVQAADPGAMLRFNMAIQDVMASLGVALEPIVEVATQIADQWNAVFTELQPILMPVAELFGQTMKVTSDAVGAFFRPVIEALAPALRTLLEAIQPLSGAMTALWGALGELTGVLVQGFMAALAPVLPIVVSGLRMLADALTLTVTTIAVIIERLRSWNLVGAFNIVSAANEAQSRVQQAALLRQQPSNAHTTAARQPQLIGIEELGQQARLAAFGARTQRELQADANALLQQIVNNTAGNGFTPGQGFGWNQMANSGAMTQDAGITAALNGA